MNDSPIEGDSSEDVISSFTTPESENQPIERPGVLRKSANNIPNRTLVDMHISDGNK